MASLHAAKQQLRSLMKQKLGAISQESVKSQSIAVLNTLKSFRPYVDASRISVFLSMPTGEIQTDVIVRDALRSGKQVFVPYLHKNLLLPSPATSEPSPSEPLPARVMDMVRLRDLADYEALRPDRWGIPSVDAATVHERQRVLGGPDAGAVLDLVLMPGVAFGLGADGGVRRLGHGRGFYDYFVSRYRATMAAAGGDSCVPLYGLALAEQFLSGAQGELGEGSVPVGPLDEPLDGLILGSGQAIVSSTAAGESTG